MSSEQLAGRELDAAIAEKLFGWRWYEFDGRINGYTLGRVRAFVAGQWSNAEIDVRNCSDMTLPLAADWPQPPPRYSESWDAMRLVVEAMMMRGWFVDVKCGDYQTGRSYDVEFHRWDDGCGAIEVQSTAETLPVAVCRAALAALEHEAELRQSSEVD